MDSKQRGLVLCLIMFADVVFCQSSAQNCTGHHSPTQTTNPYCVQYNGNSCCTVVSSIDAYTNPLETASCPTFSNISAPCLSKIQTVACALACSPVVFSIIVENQVAFCSSFADTLYTACENDYIYTNAGCTLVSTYESAQNLIQIGFNGIYQSGTMACLDGDLSSASNIHYSMLSSLLLLVLAALLS